MITARDAYEKTSLMQAAWQVVAAEDYLSPDGI